MTAWDDRTAEALARIYDEVLGVEGVDDEESFFALGGSSLLTLLLVERVADDLGVDVPLEDFYDNPTLAGLRAAVRASSPHRPGAG